MQDESLSKVMLPNGTFKTTGRHRLDDLNEFTLPFISALSGHLRIMDVAASSGSTTEEWSAQLSRAGVSFSITATDKSPFAFRVLLAPGIAALVDAERRPLHFILIGHGISPKVRGVLAPVKLALRGMARLNRSPLSVKIPLSNGLSVLEDDMLAPSRPEWIGAFDVIRAANILNREYFPESEICSMLATVRQRVKPSGLLIVSRTREEDGKNEATIFKGGKPVAHLNGGSEVTGLVQPTTS